MKNVKKNYRATETSEVNFEIHLTSYHTYLHYWKGGTPQLRSEVGEYVKSLYSIFEDKLGVSINDITNPSKRSAEATFARCVLSYVLRKKYGDKLSTDEIGSIIGIDHSGVSQNSAKFGILGLTQRDLSNLNSTVERCYEAYTGKRKPTIRSKHYDIY